MFFRRAKKPEPKAPATHVDPAPAQPELWVPPGHYYSPIADLEDLKAREGEIFARDAPLADINLQSDAQIELFETLALHAAPLVLATTEAEANAAGQRYYSENDQFGVGDALVFAAMLLAFKPKRVIEIGSGFSSALMLDINDRFFASGIERTFIEPFPEDRLTALLRDTDKVAARVIPAPVQRVPISVFDELKAGDILFVDSTHITKAGSDVNHIFFRVLPALARGVIIHFHDIFHPFEYPREWFFNGNRSWNELYLLRAFLMNNRDYRVMFFNSYFAHTQPVRAAALPAFHQSPGGSFWMIKGS